MEESKDYFEVVELETDMWGVANKLEELRQKYPHLERFALSFKSDSGDGIVNAIIKLRNGGDQDEV